MSDRFTDWKDPEIRPDGSTEWGWHVHPRHQDKLTLGKYVDIGFGTYLQPEEGITIGDDVQIGSHCSIYSVSTIDNKRAPVRIGRGAKIGTHSSVMPGVTIGENAIIGAHSFVNADIPAGATAFGVPAKVRKSN
jgi:acetyltransferase-like isoleucine patch superfamily enzyme